MFELGKSMNRLKEYAWIVLRTVGIVVLYDTTLTVGNEHVDNMFARLSLPKKSEWMFLSIKLLAMYIGIVVLWRLILQRSQNRKRHLAGLLPPDLSYRDSVKGTLGFSFFWIESLAILLSCAALSSVRSNVTAMLGMTNFGTVTGYLTSLFLYVLPLLFAFCHIEAQMRREWAEEWYFLDEGRLRRFREGNIVEKTYYKKLALNLVLYYFGMMMFPMLMIHVVNAVHAFSVFGEILPELLITLLVIFLLWFSWRLGKARRRRAKFVREMTEICEKYRFKFTHHFTVGGLLSCTGKHEFTVKTASKTYCGCLLPVPNKMSAICFSPFEDVYYFSLPLPATKIRFLKHKLSLKDMPAKAEGQENVIVLTRRPNVWRFGNAYGGHNLDNASVLNGKQGSVVLYDLAGFISTIEMEGIRQSRTIWQ